MYSGSAMKARLVLFALLFCGLLPTASAFCRYPQPRLVCAEATDCQAVVVAQLLSTRHVEPKSDVDYFLYSLRLRTSLQGTMPAIFDVHEGNDSGRAPFEWVVGQQYLLFLFWVPEDHGWELDGCGNSAPLAKASATLKTLSALRRSHADPLLSGRVSGSKYAGIPNVTITASDGHRSCRVTTGSDGEFQLRVPPGIWLVTARLNGSAIPLDSLSYSANSGIHLTSGSCVQLQFTAFQ